MQQMSFLAYMIDTTQPGWGSNWVLLLNTMQSVSVWSNLSSFQEVMSSPPSWLIKAGC